MYRLVSCVAILRLVSLSIIFLLLLVEPFINTCSAQDHAKLYPDSLELNRVRILCKNLDSLCTTDPTYKFLAAEQLKAYCATCTGQKELALLLQRRNLVIAADKADSIIKKSRSSFGSSPKPADSVAIELIGLKPQRKLITCYEDPFTFYMIDDLVSKVEKARKQLKLPLKMRPIYGTLPTTEINAYTYPPVTDKDAVEKRGSIIGFNTQLFMFAYQMPKITLPTVDINLDTVSEKVVLNISEESTVKVIENNPDLQLSFVMAVLQFLQLTEPEIKLVDPKLYAPLITLAIATELFTVAHEYGHLIKGHTLENTKRLELFSSECSKPRETLVAVRSWKQELEADEIGVKLLVRVLKNEIAEAKNEELHRALQARFSYSLYGPLFFFQCSEIIKEAKYIKCNGILPPTLTEKEKSYIRDLANEPSTYLEKRKYLNIDSKSHPPGWLRYERLVKIIDGHLKAVEKYEGANYYSILGKGLINNIKLLWRISSSRFPFVLRTIQDNKIPEESCPYID